MDIQGSTVLITGGSKGIGAATARLLADHGAHVALTARDADRAKMMADEIGGLGIQADVGQQADVKRTFEVFFEHYNELDVLINNAGTVAGAPIGEVSMEEMEAIYRTNVFGPVMMANEAVPHFRQRQYGNIVNIGSTAGVNGMRQGTIYSSSKFALRGLSECWKAELRRDNVRVFQINPSEVRTSFGAPDGTPKEEIPSKLRGQEIAHTIHSLLTMDDRGFIPELNIIATNP
jgi:3-oxoacyl-[acyl-carrier protein] reductase